MHSTLASDGARGPAGGLRPIGAALATLLAAITAAPLSAQVDWRALTLPGERRAVAYFPEAPTHRRDTLVTAIDTVVLDRYYSSDPTATSGNRLYTLSVFSYPEGALPADSLALRSALFEESVAATASSLAGEVIFSAPLAESSYPGWVFRIDYGGGAKTAHNRAFIVAKRFYHLQVFSLDGDEGTRSRERFFDTFAPSEPPDGPGAPR